MNGPQADGAPPDLSRRWFLAIAGALVLFQLFLGVLQVADLWTRGHNGWNGAAYHLSARNSLRWDLLFPLQYYTGAAAPNPNDVYTHHPLAMHLHNVASVWLFGDHEASIRGVAALQGVLAVASLLLFVRRFWSGAHAAVAAFVYVASPINAIYVNMANHSSGFIAWGLAFLYAYLESREAEDAGDLRRRRRARIAMFACYACAAAWDWPAAYLALFVALHWYATARGSRGLWRALPAPGHRVAFAGFCAFVLSLAVGHFALAAHATGNPTELLAVVRDRQSAGGFSFGRHLRIVPELMFTYPMLAVAAGWLLRLFVRIARGRAEARDLAGAAFGIGGAAHYALFKWSAVVHSYWGWTMLPFFAIASAEATVGLGTWLGALARRWHLPRSAQMVIATSAILWLTPFVVRSIDLVPEGRHVGGSLWFVRPERTDVPERYDSGRAELRFAAKVREWTDRNTGVLVHRSFDARRPEPRFYTTLDRETRPVVRIPAGELPNAAVDGWVFIAPISALPRPSWEALASHPIRLYGGFAMVDLRRAEPRIEATRLEEAPATLEWTLLRSPFEPPVAELPDPVRAAAWARPHVTQ